MSHDDLPYCGECGVSHDPVCKTKVVAVGVKLAVPVEVSIDLVNELTSDAMTTTGFAVLDTVVDADPDVIFPPDSGGGGF